jgi:cytochrome P450
MLRQNPLAMCSTAAALGCRMQAPEFADGPMPMPKEPVMQVSRADFARLLSGRAQHLLERMADEIERDEAKSALGRLLADEIANEHDAEAEAIRTAMHWAPAVVAGNTTEAELVRRFDGIISPELMSAAVASYRDILCSVARRWAGAIANGHATEVAVVDELGMPAEVVSAAVAEYKRAYGKAALAKAAEEAERAAWTFLSVLTRK